MCKVSNIDTTCSSENLVSLIALFYSFLVPNLTDIPLISIIIFLLIIIYISKNGEAGCGSNSDACYGDLVCSNNRCIEGSAPTPAPTPPPPTTSTTSYIIYNRNPVDTEYYCFDLFGGSTANTNKVWYSRCNFSPGTYDQCQQFTTVYFSTKCGIETHINLKPTISRYSSVLV